MFRHVWRPAAVAGAAALALTVTQPASISVGARATLEVVASGLVNPRGLTFGPEGGLYVAEAGSGGAGPCIVNSNNVLVCYGATGAVTRIALGGTPSQARVVTGLPSLAPGPGTTNAGSSATGAHDVEFQGRGNGYVTIGAALDPIRRVTDAAHPEFASVGMRFGRLVRFQPNGKWSFQEDIAGFETLANPDDGLLDSNPYSVVALPGRQVFTDAGGNSLNAVAANGAISNLAAFPNGTTATGQAYQAVPTGLTIGPDGAFYVGQLTGFPFPLGGANVYRVPANGGDPEVYASGFTKIIDLAFAPDGSLYVLQITSAGGPPPQAGPGSLLRVVPGQAPQVVVAPGQGLVAPGGLAIAQDGTIYVSNMSVSPNAGTVVKIVP